MPPLFVISLNSPDHPRNAELSRILGAAGFAPAFIAGVRGRDLPAGDYFDLVQMYRQQRGQVMTPSEVGCALSHVAVFNRMIESGAECAVVLEDDVLLDAIAIERLRRVLQLGFHRQGYLSLGGQEGVEYLIRLAHGRLVDEHDEVWELMPEDLGRLHRTVGYVISLDHARSMAQLASKGLYIVDDYEFIARQAGIGRFFVCNCVGHPVDLARSAIEAERAASRLSLRSTSKPLRQRVADEVLATVAARRARRIYQRKAAGLRPIEWVSRFRTQRDS